ncbi:MAG: CocE/NonD family hydrolase [Gammaproteobacteria bacterium]|nr:CocE/NonD family hydrolase [Gammaproteobacteria bacterium]
MLQPIRIALLLVTFLVSATSVAAKICLQLPDYSNAEFSFIDDVKVTSFDNAQIAANLFIPKQTAPASGFPTIIFVNSWVLDEHQYMLQAKQFAAKGYLVFSYSARGWGCSDGQVNVAGDNDISDLSMIIDWLLANTAADPNNIGISGISYGSGISLLGLAKEPRIKTAVAMSTWASLAESLYQNETPRLFWGFLLVASGFLTADLEPIINQNYQNLIFNRDIPQTLEWAQQRSADQVINLINERQAPVYLANNFGDNLFQPNNLIAFYQQLSGPKRLDLNQGTHASAEGFGLIGLNNYTWNNTHRWFDYWLKGVDNGIMDQPAVTMDVANGQRVSFANWPSNNTETRRFYLTPRSLLTHGGLDLSPHRSWWPKTNRIYSGIDTLATTGIPLVSEVLDAHLNLPVKTPLGLIARSNGIVFQSERLATPLAIRGIPKLSINLSSYSSKWQLNAYLYDVDRFGVGTLITHGPITRYAAPTHQRLTVDWNLVASAYDVPAGHKIALAIDTADALYAPPTLLPYQVDFKFANQYQSTLEITVVND